MPYTFTPMNKADAEAICAWQFDHLLGSTKSTTGGFLDNDGTGVHG